MNRLSGLPEKVLSAVRKDLPHADTFLESFTPLRRFFVSMLVAVALLVTFPEIAMYLPSQIRL